MQHAVLSFRTVHRPQSADGAPTQRIQAPLRTAPDQGGRRSLQSTMDETLGNARVKADVEERVRGFASVAASTMRESTRGASFVRRRLHRFAGTVLVLVFLGLGTFALPVQSWRTGQQEWHGFVPLAPEQRAALPRRVWIDTDAACGQGSWRDPDDCLALLAALSRGDLDVVGVSTVFGNASLDTTDATARELVGRFIESGGRAVPVYRGCGRAAPACPAGQDADSALRRAIEQGPLTILALGPLTNVALALGPAAANRPDVHVLAVMGRRPGHRFHPTEGRSTAALLFGHGPVFRDLNFALDPQAATSVLGAAVPLTLIPYEAARGVPLGEDDLDRVGRQGTLGAWVAARSRGWLEQWRRAVGLDAFYPFDLVAVMYLIAPDGFDCARVLAWVGRDHRRSLFERSAALLVAQDEPPDNGVAALSTAVYCGGVRQRVADVL
jgi:purine nucleosidase